MANKRVLVVIIAAALLGAVILAACSFYGDGKLSSSITFVVREGLEADGLAKLAKDFGHKQNIAVKVERLGRENYEANVITDLLSKQPAYDVVFLPGTLVAEMANKQATAPIEGLAANDLDDFLDVVRYKGQVFAIPTDVSTFYFIYREDIVNGVPATWSEIVKNNGIRLKDGAKPQYAFAFSCRPGEELPKMFYPFLWSYGGYLVENGQVGLATTGGIKAATLFRDLTKTTGFPDDFNTWEVGRILDELQKGHLASAGPQWNAVYPIVHDQKGSLGASFRATNIPGVLGEEGKINTTNFMHFWTLTKSSRSKQSKIANDLILYVTSSSSSKEYAVDWKGTPARKSVLHDSMVRTKRPDFVLLSECLTNAKAEPSVAFYAKMHQIMNDELSLLLLDKKTPEKAMQDATDAIKKLLEVPGQ